MKRDTKKFTACSPPPNSLVAFPAKASPSFATGLKGTNRYKSTATAINVDKAAAIDAVNQEASGAAGGGVTSATDDAKKSAPAPEEPWIVGRLMERLDERLGAKHEKLREFFVNMMYVMSPFDNDAAAVSRLFANAIQRGSLSL